ncbi:MAG TPA: LysM peptidoglycan-binding domain-containing protein, partial [Aggregatilineales bacterium]|nr:LysM peptidoglycan-binding domain-containing protein [Aggregatilineales bacterium]
QQGEDIFRIALQYGTTVEAIAAANGISDPSHIFVGQVLIIPTASNAPAGPATPTSQPPTPVQGATPVPPAPQPPAGNVYYTVQAGDTLSIIARKFGVSYADMLTANPLADPNHIEPGQQIVVPGTNSPVGNATVPDSPSFPPPGLQSPTLQSPTIVPPTIVPPAPQTQQSSSSQTYVVQPGEGLAAISRKFNVPWPTIAEANNITDPNTIYAGMTLTIPGASVPVTTMETSAGAPPGPSAQAQSDKSILVVLHEQRVYAYQSGALIHTTLASTGLPGTPTVLGTYQIYLKYTAQLMVGPGYYLPGVPWVMYFYEGYSLHGTYWHHNFGHPMSHGCVNLPTDEALWFYNWADVGTTVQVVA